jgi:hypothetical protein
MNQIADLTPNRSLAAMKDTTETRSGAHEAQRPSEPLHPKADDPNGAGPI